MKLSVGHADDSHVGIWCLRLVVFSYVLGSFSTPHLLVADLLCLLITEADYFSLTPLCLLFMTYTLSFLQQFVNLCGHLRAISDLFLTAERRDVKSFKISQVIRSFTRMLETW